MLLMNSSPIVTYYQQFTSSSNSETSDFDLHTLSVTTNSNDFSITDITDTNTVTITEEAETSTESIVIISTDVSVPSVANFHLLFNSIVWIQLSPIELMLSCHHTNICFLSIYLRL